MNASEARPDVYSRPAARFVGDGSLEVRASAAAGCRRALWYAATGRDATDPPDDESLTVMETGRALEPVVLHAMERAGWEIDHADPAAPEEVSVEAAPNVRVVGHPDATGRMPLKPDPASEEASRIGMLLFGSAPAGGRPYPPRGGAAGRGTRGSRRGTPAPAGGTSRSSPPTVSVAPSRTPANGCRSWAGTWL